MPSAPRPLDDALLAPVAQDVPQQQLPAAQGVTKRYRTAPAKTFQCRGYGDCRMVFSRSEHLARHVRKHTGERPFTCHCSKQFSRLDNLRQHAQTVHADKQDLNEKMMRDLTALHTSMAASHKASAARSKRQAAQQQQQQQQQQHLQAPHQTQLQTPISPVSSMDIKDEEMPPAAPLGSHTQSQRAHSYGQQRPGTSVGYEVGPDSTAVSSSSHSFPGTSSWQLPAPTQQQQQQQQQQGAFNNGSPPTPPPTTASRQAISPLSAQPAASSHPSHNSANRHSFRDLSSATSNNSTSGPGQSFRVPPASQHHQYHNQQHSSNQQQSFLSSPGNGSSANIFAYNVPGDSSPTQAHVSSGSRPTTANRERESASLRPTSSSFRPPGPQPTLPPLSTVVAQSNAFHVQQQQHQQQQQQYDDYSRARRPSTAPRPGTAPASYLSDRLPFGTSGGHGFPGGYGYALGPLPEFVVPARRNDRFSAASGGGVADYGYVDRERSGRRSSAGREPGSPPGTAGGYDRGGPNEYSEQSPFSYQPPSLADPPQPTATAAAAAGSEPSHFSSISRKRPLTGAAGPGSSAGTTSGFGQRPGTRGAGEYDYGSESRPQSRRLSVMELINTDEQFSADPAAAGRILPLPIPSSSRPSTASAAAIPPANAAPATNSATGFDASSARRSFAIGPAGRGLSSYASAVHDSPTSSSSDGTPTPTLARAYTPSQSAGAGTAAHAAAIAAASARSPSTSSGSPTPSASLSPDARASTAGAISHGSSTQFTSSFASQSGPSGSTSGGWHVQQQQQHHFQFQQQHHQYQHHEQSSRRSGSGSNGVGGNGNVGGPPHDQVRVLSVSPSQSPSAFAGVKV